ncbi:MAG: hypothetical protein ACYTEX_12815 [Planctomycetota bacterium]|jgi:hypothetical protein
MRNTRKAIPIVVPFCVGYVPVCLASPDGVISRHGLLRAVPETLIYRMEGGYYEHEENHFVFSDGCCLGDTVPG